MSNDATETAGRALVGDHGPIYAETRPGRFPVDTWATFTNLVFLFTLVYWALRVRRAAGRQGLLKVALPILAVGWVGGTVYHATRSHDVWLLLDWMPILLLALLATYWLWRDFAGSRVAALGALLLTFVLMASSHMLPGLSHGDHILIGYSTMALAITVPALAHCARRHRAGWRWLAVAMFSFAVAIAARQLDRLAGGMLLPMGTHFLWHIFGGVSAFSVFGYLFTAAEPAHNTGASSGVRPAA